MFGKPKYKNLAEAAVRNQAHKHNIKIENIKVMPNHIHALVQLPKGMTDSKAIQILKGGSARILFNRQPKLRMRYPRGHIWSRGYFSSTVGFTDMQTVSHYIENQEKAHLPFGQRTLFA